MFKNQDWQTRNPIKISIYFSLKIIQQHELTDSQNTNLQYVKSYIESIARPSHKVSIAISNTFHTPLNSSSQSNYIVDANQAQSKVEFYFKDSIKVSLDSIKSFGKNLLGIPYKYGGDTQSGFDCSGFTQYLFKRQGVPLPHNANMQSKLGDVISLDSSHTGDMIFFGRNNHASHAGVIYDNVNGKISIIHCVSKGVAIDTEQFHNYWEEKVLCVKRILY